MNSIVDELWGTLHRYFAAHADSSAILAFSGGIDSTILAIALLGSPEVERGGAAPGRPEISNAALFVLTSSRGGRDADRALQTAGVLGAPCEKVIVHPEEILSMITTHRGLLAGLENYTQKILAVCELFLCRTAAGSGAALVAGHGPEAIFGGFRRHAAPTLDQLDGLLRESNVNLSRLKRVAEVSQVEILLPYFNPVVWNLMLELRRAGLERIDVVRNVMPDYQLSEPSDLSRKAALQNGSGVHYLFQRAAKNAGFRYVREYMEHLIR